MSVSENDTRRSRLLIAHADPSMRSLLTDTLGKEFEVVGTAVDSEDGVKVAAWVQPDAALIDAQLSAGDALRAVEGIASVSPDTAIVILSSEEPAASLQELLGAGAIAYCRKDEATSVLARALRDAIELWRDQSFAEDIDVYSALDFSSWEPPRRSRGAVAADW